MFSIYVFSSSSLFVSSVSLFYCQFAQLFYWCFVPIRTSYMCVFVGIVCISYVYCNVSCLSLLSFVWTRFRLPWETDLSLFYSPALPASHLSFRPVAREIYRRESGGIVKVYVWDAPRKDIYRFYRIEIYSVSFTRVRFALLLLRRRSMTTLSILISSLSVEGWWFVTACDKDVELRFHVPHFDSLGLPFYDSPRGSVSMGWKICMDAKKLSICEFPDLRTKKSHSEKFAKLKICNLTGSINLMKQNIPGFFKLEIFLNP